MSRIIACLVLGCVIGSTAAPLYADVVAKEPVSEAEGAALAAQQTQDAAALTEVAGGDAESVLAAVGVIFIVLIIAAAIS